jgi:urease accessory protein
VKARARVVVESDGTGGSRLAVCYGEAPLLPRRTGPRGSSAGEGVEVHLVGGAAGPLSGDDLLVELEVGPGAWLRVRTVAATIVLGGRSGPSRTTIRACVAAGGRLDWLPEPLVATAVCDHVARASVDLAEGAWLTWREELVCGRAGEDPGDLVQATEVRLDGRALSVQEQRVGPSAPGWAGPAGLGGHRTVGSVLMVDAPVLPRLVDAPGLSRCEERDGARGALLPLASGPAVLASATAVDAYRLRGMLTGLIHESGYDTATGGSSARNERRMY